MYYTGFMKLVTKRQLNHGMAQVLEGIRPDEPVVITEHGQPRWEIAVYSAQADSIAVLARMGRITPERNTPAPWPAFGDGEYSAAQIDALLAEARGDR